MKYCKNCGQQAADKSRYCSSCGEYFSEEGFSVKEESLKFCQSCGSKTDKYYCPNCGAYAKKISFRKGKSIANIFLKTASKVQNVAKGNNSLKYKNINKTKTVKNLEKKKRRLQRSISRKYTKNKKGEKYCKTSNIIKSERKLLILNHRLKNIRHNHIHQMTSKIIKRDPSFICIEDLNVQGIMKNRHLSKAIQQQCLYEVRRQIIYKGEWNNTLIVLAPRFYPSSKMCRCCKTIKKDLKLNDRVFKCSCGNIIDRDYQASLNLEDYGYSIYNTQQSAS